MPIYIDFSYLIVYAINQKRCILFCPAKNINNYGKKSSAIISSTPPLRLLVPLDDDRKLIRERITRGKEILDFPMNNKAEYDTVYHEYRKWNDYNSELLRQIFNNNEPMDEYYYSGSVRTIHREPTLSENLKELKDQIVEKIHRLESRDERLVLIPLSEETEIKSDKFLKEASRSTNRVFVVHGHDEAARETVARFIDKLGFEPVILHEQPSAGLTIIEKIERYSDVGFAVVLLTKDDEARKLGTSDEFRPRARQNVVLELGYFVRSLGRKNVCALHSAEVAISQAWYMYRLMLMEVGGSNLRRNCEKQASLST